MSQPLIYDGSTGKSLELVNVPTSGHETNSPVGVRIWRDRGQNAYHETMIRLSELDRMRDELIQLRGVTSDPEELGRWLMTEFRSPDDYLGPNLTPELCLKAELYLRLHLQRIRNEAPQRKRFAEILAEHGVTSETSNPVALYADLFAFFTGHDGDSPDD